MSKDLFVFLFWIPYQVRDDKPVWKLLSFAIVNDFVFRFTLTKKNFIFVLIALVLAAFFVLKEEFRLFTKDGAHVYAFSVSQGDAFFLESREGVRVLVDGGPSDGVTGKLDSVLPFRDRRLDYVILTHPHADHLTGLISVLDRYSIGRMIMTGVVHTTDEYLSFLEKVKRRKIPTIFVSEPDEWVDQDVRFKFLWPQEDLQGKKVQDTASEGEGGLNDTSIITKITLEEVRLLFPGDASVAIEKELLAQGIDVGADILALGHHGSKHSSSEGWLRAVHPKVALVSAASGNRYGLPNYRIVARVKRLGIQLFRTDEDGNIEVMMDNGSFSVKTDRNKRLTF